MKVFYLFLVAVLLRSLPGYSQDLDVSAVDPDERVRFGVDRLLHASVAQVHEAEELPVQVTIFRDSAKALAFIRSHHLKPIKSFGDQCYAIRISRTSNKINYYVLAGDGTGAMYGALDIAEAMACNKLDSLRPGDHAPYLLRRGIKFNIPLDLRAPSYSDPGDAAQQNIGNVWDTAFWHTYFDEMALHRYNVMTLWSLQPFPSMVKVPEFPGTSLNDVWRTKEKFTDSFSFNGSDFDRPYLFDKVEIIRRMTIDEKIVFWRRVMQMAADRGIEVYIFTWNLFTYGVTGVDGISRRQDNDTTIAWFRAAVREMIRTYPLLRGIGITAGEGMDNGRTDGYANEQWLWKTYGEGIRDGLKGQPGRQFTLIHRCHWASLTAIREAFKDLPCRLDLSLKYAIAHMYSIPDPKFILPAMPRLSSQQKSWLTLRNDDIYSYRWANSDFVRAFIRSIPSPEKIAGFYMGPDGYCWGRDYLCKLGTTGPPPLIIQKQWYSFMLWGRLAYDPDLPEASFRQHLAEHFPSLDGDLLMQGWAAASMVFPWITRFVWGDIDLKWFPEANISHPSYKGFYTVKDYVECIPMDGSKVEGILPWRSDWLKGQKSQLLTPLDVADTLAALSHIAFKVLAQLPMRRHDQPDELNQTLSDITGMAILGSYYSEKIRAACNLALLDTTRDEQYRQKAIENLRTAKDYWDLYAAIYTSKNKPALYNRVGYVDMDKLKAAVTQDLEIVAEWKPGSDTLQLNSRTESPFKQ